MNEILQRVVGVIRDITNELIGCQPDEKDKIVQRLTNMIDALEREINNTDTDVQIYYKIKDLIRNQ